MVVVAEDSLIIVVFHFFLSLAKIVSRSLAELVYIMMVFFRPRNDLSVITVVGYSLTTKLCSFEINSSQAVGGSLFF